MSRHNRSVLPTGEEQRLETLNEKILAALKESPKTNKRLSLISLDYGRRIRDLRKANYNIRRERLEGGLNLYTLLDRPDPEWLVNVCVYLADGRCFFQKIIVNANDIGTAKNRAQHLATKIKILDATRRDPIRVKSQQSPSFWESWEST